MTSYNEIFKKAFSDAQPSIPNDIALRKILERSRTKTRRFPKKAAAILIAAAVLLIGGVGAAAASGWDLAGAFTRLFALRSQDTDINHGDYNPPLDFKTMGTPLDITIRCDGFVVDIKGMIAGKNTVYTIYELTVDNSSLLGNENDKWELAASAEMLYTGGGKRIYQNSCDNGLISRNGNTFIFFSKSDFATTNNNDTFSINGETVCLRLHHILRMGENGIKQLSINETINIPISFDIYEESRTFNVNKEIMLSGDSVTIEKILFTGFTAKFCLSKNNSTDTFEYLKNAQCVMLDGSICRFDTGAGSHADGLYEFTITTPVDVNEINAVIIDDNIIRLS